MPLSNVAFGAEEKDLHSGVKLLQSIENLDVFVIKIDLKQKTIHHEIDRQKLVHRFSWKDRVKFLIIKLGAFDNAMRQAYTYKNYKLVIQIIKFFYTGCSYRTDAFYIFELRSIGCENGGCISKSVNQRFSVYISDIWDKR